MLVRSKKLSLQAIALICMAWFTTLAQATVVVTTTANQALADITLTAGSATYHAAVTIDFDTASNLSADELNISAQLVNPNDPALISRFPASPCLLLGCVTVDSAFPMLITVEPLSVPWLFHSGFENPELDTGNLTFLNAYEFEVHTEDLTYLPYSEYRLYKAPLNGAFSDVTDDVLSGSVRARGRGGAFSQFMVVQDTRASLTIALTKILDLDTRIISSALSNLLQGDLLGLLSDVNTALLVLDYTTALTKLDQLITDIETHAGIDIANVYSSDHTVVNDAGEMLSLAQTLRYTLVRLQNGH